MIIERPSIIVTSLGRTGTTFFSRLFGQIIPECDSFHEPDIVQYFGTQNRIQAFVQRVRDAGIYDMVFMKTLGKWSLISVSDARLRGDLTYEQAVQEVLRQRTHFVNSKHGRFYVESNAGYYGLMDVLSGVYQHHRGIYIIRDGRDWVASALSVGELYAKKGLRNFLAHQMPAASEFPEDELHEKWSTASLFEKLCWAWSRLNAYAVDSLTKNPHARLYKFEQIFAGKDRYERLRELVEFCTSLPGLEPERLGKLDGWLENKVNRRQVDSTGWENWSTDQKCRFETLCGPLMEKLGYPL